MLPIPVALPVHAAPVFADPLWWAWLALLFVMVALWSIWLVRGCRGE